MTEASKQYTLDQLLSMIQDKNRWLSINQLSKFVDNYNNHPANKRDMTDTNACAQAITTKGTRVNTLELIEAFLSVHPYPRSNTTGITYMNAFCNQYLAENPNYDTQGNRLISITVAVMDNDYIKTALYVTNYISEVDSRPGNEGLMDIKVARAMLTCTELIPEVACRIALSQYLGVNQSADVIIDLETSIQQAQVQQAQVPSYNIPVLDVIKDMMATSPDMRESLLIELNSLLNKVMA